MEAVHDGAFEARYEATSLGSGRPESLRNRIIKEAKDSARAQVHKSRARYVKAARYPGASAFDINAGMRECPRYGQDDTSFNTSAHCQLHEDDARPEVIEDAEIWTADEHYQRMMEEFESLEALAESNSAVPSLSATDQSCDVSGYNFWQPDQIALSTPAPAPAPANAFFPTVYANSYVPMSFDAIPLAHSRPEDAQRCDYNGHSQSMKALGPLAALITKPDSAPITESQLISEVKTIYAGLMMVEEKCKEIVTVRSQHNATRERESWKALVAESRALLQEHHEFMSASQHPVASGALKQLAIKYAMPKRMWRYGIQPALKVLSDTSGSASSLASFVHLTYDILEDLASDMPHLQHEWNMIRYNLREYCLELTANGVDIPTEPLDTWDYVHSPAACELRKMFPPMSDNFFGDDETVEWYTQSLWSSDRPLHGSIDAHNLPKWSLSIEGLQFMSGWLQFGRKIATSFHSFAHTFIFLGLVGSRASFGKRQDGREPGGSSSNRCREMGGYWARSVI